MIRYGFAAFIIIDRKLLLADAQEVHKRMVGSRGASARERMRDSIPTLTSE